MAEAASRAADEGRWIAAAMRQRALVLAAMRDDPLDFGLDRLH
jgi:hypothetical protein